MKIRFCEKNKGKGKVVKKLQKEFPGLEIKVRGCINECSACDKKPMAVVDKERISASDGEKLYRKIVKAIKKS